METQEYRRKLPTVRIVLTVIEDLKEKKGALFKRLIILAVIMTAFETAISFTFDDSRFSALLVSWFIYGALFTLFAVTTHRVIILGPDSVPEYGLYSFSMRELRFFGWGFVAYFYLSFVTLIFTLPMNFVPRDELDESLWVLLMYILIIPGTYIFTRLSILFPATAVDERKDMSWAWDITERNGWRLLILLGVLPILIWLVPSLLVGNSLFTDVALTFAGLVVTAFEIALLSHSYKYLVGLDINGDELLNA